MLALNLRHYRRHRNLSQEELAHRAEIDRTYISDLERSVYAASIDVVDRFARVLGVEAADLLRTLPRELCRRMGDDGLRRAAYRGGWKPA